MRKLFALVLVLALSIIGIIFASLSSAPLTKEEDVEDEIEYLISMGFPEDFIENKEAQQIEEMYEMFYDKSIIVLGSDG